MKPSTCTFKGIQWTLCDSKEFPKSKRSTTWLNMDCTTRKWHCLKWDPNTKLMWLLLDYTLKCFVNIHRQFIHFYVTFSIFHFFTIILDYKIFSLLLFFHLEILFSSFPNFKDLFVYLLYLLRIFKMLTRTG